MNEYNKFNAPGVLAYIEQLQGLVSRMAANSANCKVSAVAVLAAVLALSDYDGTERCLIASIPTILFLLTDSYYLGLERRFKKIVTNSYRISRKAKNQNYLIFRKLVSVNR